MLPALVRNQCDLPRRWTPKLEPWVHVPPSTWCLNRWYNLECEYNIVTSNKWVTQKMKSLSFLYYWFSFMDSWSFSISKISIILESWFLISSFRLNKFRSSGTYNRSATVVWGWGYLLFSLEGIRPMHTLCVSPIKLRVALHDV